MKLVIEHSDYHVYADESGPGEFKGSISLRLLNMQTSRDYLRALEFVQSFVDEFGKESTVVGHVPNPPTLSELGLRYDAETGTVGPKPAEMVGPVFLDQKVGLAELIVNSKLSTPTGPFVKPSEPANPPAIEVAQSVKVPEVEQPAPTPAPEPVKEEPAPPTDPEPPTEDQIITEEFQKGCFNVKTLEQAIELWSAFYSRMSKFGKPFTDARGVDLTMALADALQIEAQEAKAMIREAIKKMQAKPAAPAEAQPEEPKPAVLDLSETVEALVKKFEELENDPKLTESEVFRSSIVICAVPGKQTTDPQRVYSVMREALERHVKSRNGSMIKGFFPTDTTLSDRILSEKNAKFLMMTKVAKLPIEKVEK